MRVADANENGRLRVLPSYSVGSRRSWLVLGPQPACRVHLRGDERELGLLPRSEHIDEAHSMFNRNRYIDKLLAQAG
jgi:hypothetical protein